MTVHPPAPPAPHRKPQRYTDDRAALNALLDEAFVCHIGMVVDGRPLVIPTFHVRIDDTCYLHASTGSGTGMAARHGGLPVSLAVTLLDALVYSRTAVHHSMNYRSAVVHGEATVVEDPVEWDRVADALIDKVSPGRSAEIVQPSTADRAATTLLALPLDQWTVKQRTGGLSDDPALADQPTWAGVVPVRLVAGDPEPDQGVSFPPPPLPTHLLNTGV